MDYIIYAIAFGQGYVPLESFSEKERAEIRLKEIYDWEESGVGPYGYSYYCIKEWKN